jgi:hypothetical protein
VRTVSEECIPPQLLDYRGSDPRLVKSKELHGNAKDLQHVALSHCRGTGKLSVMLQMDKIDEFYRSID